MHENDKPAARGETIGLFKPFIYPEPPGDFSGSPIALYRKVVRHKANPRPKQRLEQLFNDRFPGARIIDIKADAEWKTAARDAGQVVLLYTDSTGIGFGPVERYLLRVLKGDSVQVVNGRGRFFRLDSSMAATLVIRRFIERSMLGELVMAVAFIILTPIFVTLDIARGKR